MFRFFQSYDLTSEIEKELNRIQYLAQILVDEYDLYILAKSIINALEKGINIEIVIISTSDKKSMKLVNLCKRLTDLNALIYWHVDKVLFVKEDYFALFDKTFLVCSRKQSEVSDPEKLLRLKNDLFNGLTLSAKKLKLKTGDIDIEFSVDRSIVFVNEEVQLSWKTRNAHEIKITPLLGQVASVGKEVIKIEESKKFTIEAINKDFQAKKSLLVRVIEEKEIEFYVSVFDPVVNEEIPLNSSSINKGTYAVYFDQEVKISWSINMIGKLVETKIGNLPLQGNHTFLAQKDEEFLFTFKTINNTQSKRISFIIFHDEKVSDVSQNDSENNRNQNQSLITQWLEKIINTIKNLIVSLKNGFKNKN